MVMEVMYPFVFLALFFFLIYLGFWAWVGKGVRSEGEKLRLKITQCPKCLSSVPIDATICKYCQSDLGPNNPPKEGPMGQYFPEPRA